MQIPDGLDDLYQEVILDHYRKPRHRGSLIDPDLKSEGFNPFCGDQVILSIKLSNEGLLSEVAFDGQGCSISQASASMLLNNINGKTIAHAETLITDFKNVMQGGILSPAQEESMGELLALQGVREFPIRIKCALLGWTTLQDAIAEYKNSKEAKR
ncbi:MAG: SUF system NifU family Fe-S cluster assembly protein [SAR202 cluster bacterium]|nr:SUF system NifU family Fe-S cluster assembly protein [SAR202 cluster bacterium]|tara:strand:+ start:4377 stop:4844 length:468 start_codon:yes stop_codon:yes gene_type:complete